MSRSVQLIDSIETARNLKVAATNYDTVSWWEGDKPFFTPTFVLPPAFVPQGGASHRQASKASGSESLWLGEGRIYWGNFKYLWLDFLRLYLSLQHLSVKSSFFFNGSFKRD